jgi:hypothetical protein
MGRYHKHQNLLTSFQKAADNIITGLLGIAIAFTFTKIAEIILPQSLWNVEAFVILAILLVTYVVFAISLIHFIYCIQWYIQWYKDKCKEQARIVIAIVMACELISPILAMLFVAAAPAALPSPHGISPGIAVIPKAFYNRFLLALAFMIHSSVPVVLPEVKVLRKKELLRAIALIAFIVIFCWKFFTYLSGR